MARALLPLVSALTLALTANGMATFGDAGGTYPYVGRTVYQKKGTTGWTQSATGVAISPHWVITASHAGGSAFEEDGKVYQMDRRVYCPDADLLMMHTQETLPYYVPVAFESFENLKGKRVVIAGTGQIAKRTPTGWANSANTTFAVHAGANTIDDTSVVPMTVNQYDGSTPRERQSPCLVYDLDDPAGGNGSMGGPAVPGEGGQAGSDSGGAWLVKIEGKLRLVAVCGYVGPSPTNPNGGSFVFGALGYGVHLAPQKIWIETNLARR